MKLFELANNLTNYLKAEGILFTENGYPIFTEDMLLKEIPEQILPFRQAYASKDKSRTLLVSFSKNEDIYPRLFSLDKDIPKYKQFLGVGGFDLSPRINWPIELQRFNLLLSRLADAYLAIHGIKIMPNFRTGNFETFDVLQTYPTDCCYVVGSLGCAKGNVEVNKIYLRTKLILTNPHMLIYYGKLHEEYIKILNEFLIPYRRFPDFQSVSRGKEIL